MPSVCAPSSPDWKDAVYMATVEAARRLDLEDRRTRLHHLTTILPLLDRTKSSFQTRVDEFVTLINEIRGSLRPWIEFADPHESMMEQYNRVIGNMNDPEFMKKMDEEAAKMWRALDEQKRQQQAQAGKKPAQRRRPAGV